MDNWRKFGNPDGKQPMEVSIALPTFLLEKEHHNTILIIYLIAMVVIIPCKTTIHYTIGGPACCKTTAMVHGLIRVDKSAEMNAGLRWYLIDSPTLHSDPTKSPCV